MVAAQRERVAAAKDIVLQVGRWIASFTYKGLSMSRIDLSNATSTGGSARGDGQGRQPNEPGEHRCRGMGSADDLRVGFSNSIALADAGSIADQVSTLAGRGHNVQLVASGKPAPLYHAIAIGREDRPGSRDDVVVGPPCARPSRPMQACMQA